jgi:hypothetical protein
MLAKSVHDAGWSQFVSILSCKAEAGAQGDAASTAEQTEKHGCIR